MKRIKDLVKKSYEKFGGESGCCIGLDVWKYHHTEKVEVEWNFWDGDKSHKFKTFQELTDYLVLERGV